MRTIALRHRLEIAFRRAWFLFKILLRQNIGTDKNFYAGDAAMRLSKGILPPGVRVTCAGRSDGLGKQAMARISGMNFAEAFGATYVDSPFTRIGHARGEMSTWVDAWEGLFSFGKGEERIGDRDYKIIDYADYLLRRPEITDNVVLRFQQCYWLNRRDPDSFNAIAGALRAKFGTKDRARDRNSLIVAVHVRRGDVGRNRNAQRFTPNGRILHTIKLLREVLDDLRITAAIHVHSQGASEEFSDFAKIGCELFLDTDAVWTMQQLAEADVLVMAKSSFSYIAALLNEGVVLYEPMFDPPLSSWIVRRKNGHFDQKRAMSALDTYLNAAHTVYVEGSALLPPDITSAAAGSSPT